MKSRVLAVAIALVVSATLSVATGSSASASVPKVHPMTWPQCC